MRIAGFGTDGAPVLVSSGSPAALRVDMALFSGVTRVLDGTPFEFTPSFGALPSLDEFDAKLAGVGLQPTAFA